VAGTGNNKSISDSQSQTVNLRQSRGVDKNTVTNGVVQILLVSSALVLLVAASAKTHWIMTNPFWEDLSSFGIWPTLLGIVMESLAGIALLCLRSRLSAAAVGVVIHGILFAAGAWFLLADQRCNCFGVWTEVLDYIPKWGLPVYNLLLIAGFLSVIAISKEKWQGKSDFPSVGTWVGISCGYVWFPTPRLAPVLEVARALKSVTIPIIATLMLSAVAPNR